MQKHPRSRSFYSLTIITALIVFLIKIWSNQSRKTSDTREARHVFFQKGHQYITDFGDFTAWQPFNRGRRRGHHGGIYQPGSCGRSSPSPRYHSEECSVCLYLKEKLTLISQQGPCSETGTQPQWSRLRFRGDANPHLPTSYWTLDQPPGNHFSNCGGLEQRYANRLSCLLKLSPPIAPPSPVSGACFVS